MENIWRNRWGRQGRFQDHARCGRPVININVRKAGSPPPGDDGTVLPIHHFGAAIAAAELCHRCRSGHRLRPVGRLWRTRHQIQQSIFFRNPIGQDRHVEGAADGRPGRQIQDRLPWGKVPARCQTMGEQRPPVSRRTCRSGQPVAEFRVYRTRVPFGDIGCADRYGGAGGGDGGPNHPRRQITRELSEITHKGSAVRLNLNAIC